MQNRRRVELPEGPTGGLLPIAGGCYPRALCQTEVEKIGAAAGKDWFVGPVLLKSRDAKAASVVHAHEVFGPCATILPYDGTAAEATALVRKGMGGLVSSVFSDDREFVGAMIAGIAAWHGRLYLGSAKMADQSVVGPGGVRHPSFHVGAMPPIGASYAYST